MAFGVYVHIPYCLQRCVYCDFATYEFSQILEPQSYVELVKKEITSRASVIHPRKLDTLYFGGGTPSLLEPSQLIEIINTLKENGFELSKSSEVTIEINPATLTQKKLEALIKGGFNRFSVGAQSFNDRLLKIAHRKHSAQDTRDTLSLLNSYKLNFSVDVLFALPTQTLDDLAHDLDEIQHFNPPHVSPYCLTVPESNPMAKNRPQDEVQIEMFSLIETRLLKHGLNRYEISNFAKPGFESRHNLLYWNDDEYWGIGLSSHSYLHRFEWGSRFWNPRSINDYVKQIEQQDSKPWTLDGLPNESGERLKEHQALTDFFHISLRRAEGFKPENFERKFSRPLQSIAAKPLEKLLNKRLLIENDNGYALSPEGILLSNHVFEELTFLQPLIR
ncbi:MAG: radical SAM family heme chaperone HemW [Oligoflexia bacterium]|nr:radical SAM family heme chaperone HemW [Oligoflexia bacterium]